MIIVICVVILASGPGASLFSLQSVGYTTGYQGAKARFAGIQDSSGKTTSNLWGTTFQWDKDASGFGKPGIAGEMTSCFIPSESVGKTTKQFSSGKDISSWLVDATNIKNPLDQVYEWELENEDGSTTIYRMEEWILKWFVSISSEPKEGEYDRYELPGGFQSSRRNLEDVQVWFEFDLSPIWYFENQSSCYFSVAKIRLSDVAQGGKINNEDYEDKYNSKMRVLPESEGTPLTIFYGLFGTSVNIADKTALDYQGKRLNPNLFTDRVYAYVTLQDFGVTSWWDWGPYYRGDVITYGFDIHVFVVGQWDVKDVQEIPDEYGRTAKLGTEGIGIGAFLESIIGSPMFPLYSFIALIAIIVLVLAIFAPWVLFAIFGMFGSRKH